MEDRAEEKPNGMSEFENRQRAEPEGFRPDDEISLAEIFAVLYRRRLFAVGVAVVAFAVLAAYFFSRPPQYQYVTVLTTPTTLRAIPGGEAEVVSSEPVEGMAERLRQVIAPAAVEALEADGSTEETPVPDIDVRVRKDGGQVLLVTSAPLEDSERVRRLHEEALGRLRASQETLLRATRRQYEAARNLEEIRLAERKDPVVREAERLARLLEIKRKEQALADLTDERGLEARELETARIVLRNQISALDDREAVLRARMEKQRELAALLRQETGEIGQAVAAVEARLTEAAEGKGGSVDALGLLLLTTEILRHRQRQSELEERVAVDIPLVLRDIDKQLTDLESERRKAKAELEQLERRSQVLRAGYERKRASLEFELRKERGEYARFLKDSERAVAIQEQLVRERDALMEQIRPTVALGLAQRSTEPKGRGGLSALLFALVGALFFSVLLTLFMEYLGNRASAIRGRQDGAASRGSA
ncbi:MAG: hypothetical protein Kow006_21790 [Gammaproteobacteria bacterium]